MKPLIRLSSVLALLALAAGCATVRPAKSGNAAVMNLFKQADKNGNNQVSRKEFTDLLIAEAFAMYDKDNDGVVTLAEWTAGGGTPQHFRAMGAKDGKLTLAQAQASKIATDQMAKPFDQADKNHTGYVTLDEFVAYRAASAPYIR